MVLAGVLFFSLAGCGSNSAPVTTRPTLTVTAADARRVYGAANPVFTASASGASSGDTFTFTASTVATPSSPAGTYSIVPAATGANLANYNVVYVNGTLTVDKATLTVTPNNQSIVAGSALPTFSATITGFANGDTQAVVTGQPALTTTATSSSPAGSYPIAASLGTLAAANYSFTFGAGTLTVTPAPSNPGVGFTGRAMAGSQPVVGAAVQLYAAGMSGNGSAGTALLTNTLITDAAGAFTVPAGYSCPVVASQLYVVVRGGNLGAGAAIALATPIGACNQLASDSQFVINEVTTAATAYGLAQFLSPGGNIGSSATNTRGLSNAAAAVASLANLTAGISPGASFPQNGSSPAPRINSVANLLNTCTAAASSTGCTALFSATTPPGGTAPANTLDAALNLVRNPGSNVAALYTQSTASTAFTPALTAAPSDWTMFINYTGGGMNTPTAVGVDGTGNVWVASYNSAVSEFSPTGTPVFPNGITGGGLYHSYGLAIDAQNSVWIPNEDSTPSGVNGGYGSVTVLNSGGQPTSGPTGYIAGGIAYPLAIAIDANATTWVIDYFNQHLTLLSSGGQPLSGADGYTTDLSFPISIAIDAKNNAWVGNSKTNTVTKVSSDGQFTSYACCNWAGGIAIDQRGFVWVANYMGDSISQLSADGTVISNGYSDAKASISHPQGIAVDGSGHVWVTNILGSSITELAGSAATSPGQILSPSAGWARDAGLNHGWAVAIDASGNLWVVNYTTNTLTEIVGLATPVKTPQVGPVQSP